MKKPHELDADTWQMVIPKNAREAIYASIVLVAGTEMLQLMLWKQNGKGESAPVHARCMRFRAEALPLLKEAIIAAENIIEGKQRIE